VRSLATSHEPQAPEQLRRVVDRAGVSRRRLPPARTESAAARRRRASTDSSTVMSANSRLIWNVRASPRLTRSCCARVVTSSSPRITWPAVA